MRLKNRTQNTGTRKQMKHLMSVSCVLSSVFLLIILNGCARTPSEDIWNFWGDARLEKQSQARRQDYVGRHPELVKDEKEMILRGNVWKGMTKEEAIASWGIPINIFREPEGKEVVEKWVYRPGYYHPERFLLFDRHKLLGWEEGGR